MFPGTAPIGPVAGSSVEAAGLTAKRNFVELIQAEAGDIDITREDVLVPVGRGIGDQEAFGETNSKERIPWTRARNAFPYPLQ